MSHTTLQQIVPVLQIAIGPVILISGVGLLLLSMTNRFGRIIDRSRELARELREAPDSPPLLAQLDILYRRAKVVRIAIILAVVSVLLASVLVIALFLMTLLGVDIGIVIGAIFTACLLALLASLGAFLHDIHLSLTALKLELSEARRG